MNDKILAIIPARANSKEVKNKNIKKINNDLRPIFLFLYFFINAIEIKLFLFDRNVLIYPIFREL